MRTFNDIKEGDELFIVNSIGLGSSIVKVVIKSIEETPEKQILFKTNDKDITIEKEERCHNKSSYSDCYIELEDAIKEIENIFNTTRKWLAYLLDGYNNKLESFYKEIIKWKNLLH